MSSQPPPEPPPGLAPWEPWAFYGTYVAFIAGALLRAEQANTHSHGVRVLVSTLMLIIAVFVLTESAFVLFDIRGALWKVSGRPADQQPKLTQGGRYGRPRAWCGILVVFGVACLVYAIRGL